MKELTEAIPYIVAALAAVTIIDWAGAAASRILNFSYVYLSFVSFGVYVLLGYFVSPKCGLNIGILSSLIVGFYDATVGWKLALKSKANFELSDDDIRMMTPSTNLAVMLVVSPLFAWIGYLLA